VLSYAHRKKKQLYEMGARGGTELKVNKKERDVTVEGKFNFIYNRNEDRHQRQ